MSKEIEDILSDNTISWLGIIPRIARIFDARTEHLVKPVCEHEWISARNEVIQSGEMCRKCFVLRPEHPISTIKYPGLLWYKAESYWKYPIFWFDGKTMWIRKESDGTVDTTNIRADSSRLTVVPEPPNASEILGDWKPPTVEEKPKRRHILASGVEYYIENSKLFRLNGDLTNNQFSQDEIDKAFVDGIWKDVPTPSEPEISRERAGRIVDAMLNKCAATKGEMMQIIMETK